VQAEAVVLITSTPKDLATESAQRSMLDVLAGLKVVVSTVDGAAAENKDIRSTLWSAPGAKRAAYPQLFKKAADGTFTYVADGERWTHLVECNEVTHELDAIVGELAKR